MMISEAAHQRKSRVLKNSSKRLSSLSKTEFEDDSEPNEPPSSFLNEMMLSASSKHRSKVVKPAETPISPLDLKGTQRIAFCNLISYVLSMLAGSFVCHVIHGEMVDHYCPALLRAIFSLMHGFGLGQFVRMMVSAWDSTPHPMRDTVVKGLTYGSVMANLYPMWFSMRKQGNALKAEEADVEDSTSENEENNSANENKGSGFPLDLDEQQLVMIATFVIRSCAACLVFGLLGYDALFNAPILFKYFV